MTYDIYVTKNKKSMTGIWKLWCQELTWIFGWRN